MERPNLDKNLTLKDFNDFYWLKEELISFCKTVGIHATGSKIELADNIRAYLATGKISTAPKTIKKYQSNFDWNKEALSKQTIITDNYKNTENVRRYFIAEIGSHFSFNVLFMKWIKDNIGMTLKEAIQEWLRLYELKKNKNYVTEIAPQFEYNRYMRAFLSDNPTLSSKDAMKVWKLKRARRGTNEYERTDLDLT